MLDATVDERLVSEGPKKEEQSVKAQAPSVLRPALKGHLRLINYDASSLH
jgi:hypothetical protein